MTVIFDIEASCEDRKVNRHYNMETIEIGAVKLNGVEIVDEFQTFIRPEYVDSITPFCTKLTGITFDDLEDAPSFNEAIVDFHKFIYGHTIYSCGEFDRKFLIREIIEKGTSSLHLMAKNAIESSHVNLKKHYQKVTGNKMRGMAGMARELNIDLKGKQHRGIDDARNLASIYIALENIRGKILENTFDNKMNDLIANMNKYHDDVLIYKGNSVLISSNKELVNLEIKEFIDKWSKAIIIDHEERGVTYLSNDDLKIIKKFSS